MKFFNKIIISDPSQIIITLKIPKIDFIDDNRGTLQDNKMKTELGFQEC